MEHSYKVEKVNAFNVGSFVQKSCQNRNVVTAALTNEAFWILRVFWSRAKSYHTTDRDNLITMPWEVMAFLSLERSLPSPFKLSEAPFTSGKIERKAWPSNN